MSLDKSGNKYTGAGARNVCFEGLNKDMFLEVQTETCSQILCLLGVIAYGVHFLLLRRGVGPVTAVTVTGGVTEVSALGITKMSPSSAFCG